MVFILFVFKYLGSVSQKFSGHKEYMMQRIEYRRIRTHMYTVRVHYFNVRIIFFNTTNKKIQEYFNQFPNIFVEQ